MKKISILIAMLWCVAAFAQDTITKTDIKSAAKLLDLSYTQKEIDTLYDGVKENLEDPQRLLLDI